MVNNSTNIKERILLISEYKGITRENFFRNIGMTYGNFKGKSKETPINSNAVADILTAYPDVDPNWLLTGEGSMLKSELPKVHQPMDTGTPMIPVEAFAGMGAGAVSISSGDIQDRYIIPDFIDVDFMIRITGASMYPKYMSGDIVACRVLHDRSLFQWGRVFVLHHRDQGTLIKRLFPGQDPGKVECRSDNPDFPPFIIAVSDVTNFALVIGIVRIE